MVFPIDGNYYYRLSCPGIGVGRNLDVVPSGRYKNCLHLGLAGQSTGQLWALRSIHIQNYYRLSTLMTGVTSDLAPGGAEPTGIPVQMKPRGASGSGGNWRIVDIDGHGLVRIEHVFGATRYCVGPRVDATAPMMFFVTATFAHGDARNQRWLLEKTTHGVAA